MYGSPSGGHPSGETQLPLESLSKPSLQKHPGTHCLVQNEGMGTKHVAGHAVPHWLYSSKGPQLSENLDENVITWNFWLILLTRCILLTLIFRNASIRYGIMHESSTTHAGRQGTRNQANAHFVALLQAQLDLVAVAHLFTVSSLTVGRASWRDWKDLEIVQIKLYKIRSYLLHICREWHTFHPNVLRYLRRRSSQWRIATCRTELNLAVESRIHRIYQTCGGLWMLSQVIGHAVPQPWKTSPSLHCSKILKRRLHNLKPIDLKSSHLLHRSLPAHICPNFDLWRIQAYKRMAMYLRELQKHTSRHKALVAEPASYIDTMSDRCLALHWDRRMALKWRLSDKCKATRLQDLEYNSKCTLDIHFDLDQRHTCSQEAELRLEVWCTGMECCWWHLWLDW